MIFTYLAYWGYAASIATLVVALIGPVLGTIADSKNFKKSLFFACILIQSAWMKYPPRVMPGATLVAFRCAIIFGRLAKRYPTQNLITLCIVAYLGIALFALQLDTQ